MPAGRDQHRFPITHPPYELRANRSDDPNLRELIDNWKLYHGRLVVLLGAGASIGAETDESPARLLPSANALRNEIWQQFMRPPGEAAFDYIELGSMTLDQASAFAAEKAGRAQLVEYLARRFQTRRSLWQHVAIPFLKPNAVFTTNYDMLIEQGWEVARQKDDRVPPLTTLFASGQTVPSNRIPLFKPHGSVDHLFDPVDSGGPVITTTDYFHMLTRKREMLLEWIGRTRGVCVILIGYSMSDMDIGGFLYDIRQSDNGNNWYAVFPRSDATVRKYWTSRLRIQPIDRTFAEFMYDLDAETDILPESLKYSRIQTLRRQKRIQ
jgi:hypothetical protein